MLSLTFANMPTKRKRRGNSAAEKKAKQARLMLEEGLDAIDSTAQQEIVVPAPVSMVSWLDLTKCWLSHKPMQLD